MNERQRGNRIAMAGDEKRDAENANFTELWDCDEGKE